MSFVNIEYELSLPIFRARQVKTSEKGEDGCQDVATESTY